MSVIDGRTCNATVTYGCIHTPPTVAVAGIPLIAAVNEATDSVCIATASGTVAVIDVATCNAIVTSGCGQTPATVKAGSGTIGYVVVDPRTNTIYANSDADNNVAVINGATCNATVTTGCNQTPPTVAVGNHPYYAAIHEHTNTLYVANINDNTVSMINETTCNAITTSGCGQTPPTLRTGNQPDAVAIDKSADTLYVVNFQDDSVSVIKGTTCNAGGTSR